MLVLTVTKDFDKLLKNCRLTSVTLLSKLGGVVVVTIDLAIVLIVTVLRTKDGRAQGASEVVDVVFALERSDV